MIYFYIIRNVGPIRFGHLCRPTSLFFHRITLNTRISKSSSSNFSISEFCEKIPDDNNSSPIDEEKRAEEMNDDGQNIGESKCSLAPKPILNPVMTSNPNPESKGHFSDSSKSKQSVSDSPSPPLTKCFQTRNTRPTPEWTSPLEVSRNVGVNESRAAGEGSTTNVLLECHLYHSDQEVPRVTTITQEVKDGNRNIIDGREAAILITNTETLIQNVDNSKYQSPSSSAVSSVINQNDLVDRKVVIASDMNLTAETTSPKTFPIKNINNNNESVSDMNEDNKCKCEIYNVISKKLQFGGSSGECHERRLNEGEKRVQLLETCDLKMAGQRSNISRPVKASIESRMSGASEAQNQNVNEFDLNNLSEASQIQVQGSEFSNGTRREEDRCSDNSNSEQVTASQLCISNEKQTITGKNDKVKQSLPGSKIKTNASLLMRNRNVEQKEHIQTDHLLPHSHHSNNIDSVSDSNKSSELQTQCPNSNIRTARQIHTDSPIISGFGSDRTRRRILCDYKIRRDYPELFGITPRDRRTFIKSLAEKVKADEKGLVAPYYYMTPSPLPIPKQIRNLQLQQEKLKQQQDHPPQDLPNPIYKPVNKEISEAKQPVPKPSRIPLSLSERSKIQANILARKEAEWQAHLNKFAEANKLERNVPKKSQEILEDVLEDESEGHAPLGDLVRAKLAQGRQRSPEESSSNDSGISEEVPIDKFKLTKKLNNRTTDVSEYLMKTHSSPSTATSKPSTSEVITSHFHSTSTPCTSVKNISAHVCPASASSQSQISRIKVNSPNSMLYEGDSKTSMEAVVAISHQATTTKADKATATEDDITNAPHLSDKSLSRNFMAQRREAFFLQGQSTSAMSPSTIRRNISGDDSPFKVKIYPGNSVQQSAAWTSSPLQGVSSVFTGKPWVSCDQVKYTRLEKQKTAKIERVESSDDSTSSDVASASPAPENENGTTDPSWSSSSSSLAGGSSSKEGPLSSTKVASGYGEHETHTSTGAIVKPIVSAYYHLTKGPEIVVTKHSPPGVRSNCDSEDELSDDDGKDSRISTSGSNGHGNDKGGNGSSGSCKSGGRSFESGSGLLRVESNDSTVENYGDDDEEYNFEDDEEEDLSRCSLATINRYGTYESLEKIESEDTVGGLPEFSGPTIPRSKARFTFDEDDEDDVIDDENLFEEDFESDFNFRLPTQIQDNTYSKSLISNLIHFLLSSLPNLHSFPLCFSGPEIFTGSSR